MYSDNDEPVKLQCRQCGRWFSSRDYWTIRFPNCGMCR